MRRALNSARCRVFLHKPDMGRTLFTPTGQTSRAFLGHTCCLKLSSFSQASRPPPCSTTEPKSKLNIVSGDKPINKTHTCLRRTATFFCSTATSLSRLSSTCKLLFKVDTFSRQDSFSLDLLFSSWAIQRWLAFSASSAETTFLCLLSRRFSCCCGLHFLFL